MMALEADPVEARIEKGAHDLAQRFHITPAMKAHFAMVDDFATRKQIVWLRKNRKELFARELGPAIKGSAKRHGFGR